jgi:hypothetical protein
LKRQEGDKPVIAPDLETEEQVEVHRAKALAALAKSEGNRDHVLATIAVAELLLSISFQLDRERRSEP